MRTLSNRRPEVWGFFINALSVEANNSGHFEFIPYSLTHCNLDRLSTELLPYLEVDRKVSKRLPYIFEKGWVCEFFFQSLLSKLGLGPEYRMSFWRWERSPRLDTGLQELPRAHSVD